MLQWKSISVKTLLSLVDTSVLNEAAEATQVDYQAEKIKRRNCIKTSADEFA